MIRFLLVQNRQGKMRLAKYYAPIDEAEQARIPAEVHRLVSLRDRRLQSNFVQVRPSTNASFAATRLCTDSMQASTFACA